MKAQTEDVEQKCFYLILADQLQEACQVAVHFFTSLLNELNFSSLPDSSKVVVAFRILSIIQSVPL